MSTELRTSALSVAAIASLGGKETSIFTEPISLLPRGFENSSRVPQLTTVEFDGEKHRQISCFPSIAQSKLTLQQIRYSCKSLHWWHETRSERTFQRSNFPFRFRSDEKVTVAVRWGKRWESDAESHIYLPTADQPHAQGPEQIDESTQQSHALGTADLIYSLTSRWRESGHPCKIIIWGRKGRSYKCTVSMFEKKKYKLRLK